MENLNTIPSKGTFGGAMQKVNDNFDVIVAAINGLEYRTTRSKGVYGTLSALQGAGTAKAGDWGLVLGAGSSFPATIYTYNGTKWVSGGSWSPGEVSLAEYSTTAQMNAAIASAVAGVEIETADNLTTQETGKALDARQGFVLSGQIGEVAAEVTRIKGGEASLLPISNFTGYIYNGNVAGTGIGYMTKLSGWRTYIYDVSSLAGKSLQVTGAARNQSYRYLFTKTTDLPTSQEDYDANPEKWTENMVTCLSGRGITGNVKYSNSALVVPEGANFLYLGQYVSGETSYTTSAKYTVEGIVGQFQERLVFDSKPTEGSANPVTSAGVYDAVSPFSGLLEDFYGNMTSVYVKSGKLLNHNSSNIGFWNSYTGGISYVFDVSKLVGKTITFTGWRRANTSMYAFVKSYEDIPSSLNTEVWESIVVVNHKASPNSTDNTTPFSVTMAVPAGAVYLVVSGNSTLDGFLPTCRRDSVMSQIEALSGSVNPYAYVEDEKERIVSLVKEKMHHDIVVMGFNTDQHIRQTSRETYTDPVVRGLNALRDMAGEIPFSVICLGGDAAGYSTETTQGKVDGDILDVINAVDTDKCPVVALAGNHDAGQNLSSTWAVATYGQSVFNATIKRNIVRRQLDAFDLSSTNCWFDDAASKIRFVFLDPWSRYEGSTHTGSGKRYGRLNSMLVDALADEKLENSEWGVVIFCHNVIPKDVAGNSYDAVSAGTDYWAQNVQPRIAAGVSIVACINGHGHLDSQGVKDGINFIEVQGAGTQAVSDTASFDGMRHTYTAKTAKETAYDVFVIDKTDKKIYALRYGAGTDRVFKYGTDAGICLCSLTGKVLNSDGSAASGTITATHHNMTYSSTLDSDGNYSFPYLCPERTWVLAIGSYKEDYAAQEGEFEHDVTL